MKNSRLSEQTKPTIYTSIVLDDLAAAMKEAEEPGNNGALADARAAELEKTLNQYLAGVQTVSVNCVNIRANRVDIDICSQSSEDECLIGLSFHQDDELEERAIWYVDAEHACLDLEKHNGDLVCIGKSYFQREEESEE